MRPDVVAAIHAERGGGQRLDRLTFDRLRPDLGDSIDDLRLHTDPQAQQLAAAVSARAFTVGRDVFFASGEYRPDSDDGRELIAHEAVHVAQRGWDRLSGPLRVSSPGEGEEVQADQQAARLIAPQATMEATASRDRKTVASSSRSGLLLRQQAHSQGNRASGPSFTRAANVTSYIALVREAERRMIAAGVTSVDDRIQMLSGIYYGTDWSLDFQVEASAARNVAFQVYTARTSQGTDPRPILGASLFEALKRSQDVAVPHVPDLDMGHLLIGLSARSSYTPRHVPIPSQGGTGLEISTWVGDLGAAAARVARDRLHAPGTPARRYFSGARGTDYGADSNLEGDLAAYLAGTPSGSASLEPLTVPPGRGIADALTAYFGAAGLPSSRAQRFLQIIGGTFAAGTLANRAAVEVELAGKFASFGRWYMGTRYGPAEVAATWPIMHIAATDVAHEFVEWLLRRIPSSTTAPPHSRRTP